MSQKPSFDMSKISTAGKILLGGGLLYLIFLFLSWNKKCDPTGSFCVSKTGWSGVGILCGILIIVILAMEVLVVAGVEVNVGTPQMRNMVEAGLAGALLLFTLLRVFIKPSILGVSLDTKWPAYIGLLLSLVVAYGGYMRWQESQVATPPPSPPGGGYAP